MKTHISRREFGQVVGAAALTAIPGGPAASPQNPRPAGPVPAGGSELCFLSALELATRIRQKQVSAREVMTAHLAQIERINPKVNAIVTLVADRAMADAARADEMTAKGGTLGVLHGLPVAHKDLVDTAGIRTTRGSRFYRDNVPTRDALIVEAHPRRGCPDPRQDQHARIRRRITDVQRGLWRHAQSVRSRRRHAVEAAAARPWRSPAGWCRLPTAATPAAPCATRRRSAMSSGCALRRAACRRNRVRGRLFRSRDHWRGRSATSPSS